MHTSLLKGSDLTRGIANREKQNEEQWNSRATVPFIKSER